MGDREVRMTLKLWLLRLWAGLFWSVDDGRICRLAPRLPRWADPHDYHEHKGGDGTPTHWHTYTCHRCGRKFEI